MFFGEIMARFDIVFAEIQLDELKLAQGASSALQTQENTGKSRQL